MTSASSSAYDLFIHGTAFLFVEKLWMSFVNWGIQCITNIAATTRANNYTFGQERGF